MSKTVTVYSTPTCPYCKQVKAYLGENKIDFKDVDVSSDQNAAQEMIDKSGQMGVPVVLIDQAVIVGFDKAKLAAELNI